LKQEYHCRSERLGDLYFVEAVKHHLRLAEYRLKPEEYHLRLAEYHLKPEEYHMKPEEYSEKDRLRKAECY